MRADVRPVSAAGSSLFLRVSLAFVLALLVLHLAGYYFYGHERMVDTARTFAVSAAARAYALDELLAEQPQLLPLIQNDSFSIRRVPAPPATVKPDWPHNLEVIEAVHRHLQDLGMPEADATELWFELRNSPPRLRLLLPSVE